ncbi:hypothetical protein CONPUDRAFT_76756 [Coniophora puteana RWD-64-598 SS2]|uniref:Uncharacterized protein n=1 Tax=Coniophora puteana (strain RWD-64-598) TaxID=741705 RepID=A0A5M3MC41_CONPW|nr:uncharacterized protein CONPUDRAFT_76756 [Coniophora puteana RWD-64-598 SS2]EIW76410.1 hypothetical protein CONPUDRAFT_76756 [Coniophora puteana RWD-64-598 SS2]
MSVTTGIKIWVLVSFSPRSLVSSEYVGNKPIHAIICAEVAALDCYLLDFGLEVEFIWLRYLGITWAISILLYTLEVPMPAKLHASITESTRGMMALRVYLLLVGVTRMHIWASISLLTGFVVAQGTSIIATVLYVAATAGYISDVDVLGYEYCNDLFALNPHMGQLTLNILLPMSYATMLAYEIMLGLAVLYYGLKRLRTGSYQWRQPRRTLGIMATIMLRDNFLYFIANAFLSAIMIISQAPTLQKSLVCNNISVAIQYLLFTMIGPRAILNLRKQHAAGIGERYDIEMTSLRFVSVTLVPEEGEYQAM